MKQSWLKFEDIDIGTKIRTLAAILVAINEAIAVLGDVDFGNEHVNLAYKIISTVVMILALAVNTYYNNDYTEEAMIGTVTTRTLKEDPTAVVSLDADMILEDGDEDEEDDDEPDEIIEEGE